MALARGQTGQHSSISTNKPQKLANSHSSTFTIGLGKRKERTINNISIDPREEESMEKLTYFKVHCLRVVAEGRNNWTNILTKASIRAKRPCLRTKRITKRALSLYKQHINICMVRAYTYEQSPLRHL